MTLRSQKRCLRSTGADRRKKRRHQQSVSQSNHQGPRSTPPSYFASPNGHLDGRNRWRRPAGKHRRRSGRICEQKTPNSPHNTGPHVPCRTAVCSNRRHPQRHAPTTRDTAREHRTTTATRRSRPCHSHPTPTSPKSQVYEPARGSSLHYYSYSQTRTVARASPLPHNCPS